MEIDDVMQDTEFRGLARIRRLRPLRISTWSRDRTGKSPSGKPPRSTDLLIASYNIHKAVGRDRRFDPARIVDVIDEIGADIIALQEADQRFGERAGLLDLEALKRRTGLIAAPVQGRGHGWHGNVVLFRPGIVTATREIVLPGVEPRGALIVDLSLPRGDVRIIGAHLGLLRHSRSRQIETLIGAAKPTDGRPVFLMGDFNEWRVGRRSALQGLAPKFGPLQAAIPSFPARFPLLALDRIVAYPADLVASVELHDSPLARIASDHLPIKAQVHLLSEDRSPH